MAESCPHRDLWRQLLDGSLAAEAQAELTGHLDACAACRRIIDELAAAEASWSKIPAALRETAPPEPALGVAMAQIKQAGASSTGTVPEADTPGTVRSDDLSFLKPSAAAGHLGRLDHYEILELVGRGGMGIVLKAMDGKLHRVVAIKVLAPELAANATARKRFVREARAAAAVSHDHVVGIFAVDEEHTPPYLAMQFVQGMSLQDKLDRQGPLELKEILRIGMQTAHGLAAAHGQGLVHRDIKPANILLENGVERVKLTDFGLARAVNDASVTQSGVIAGTPMYMSPEQAGGEPVDHRSDLFSLGSVLYTMATGHPPFRAADTMAVLCRVVADAPRPIREFNADVPDWLEHIVAKLHAKKPAARFQTAKEVADLLGQHLAHLQQPGQTPMPAAIAPITEPAQRALKTQPAPRRLRWAFVALVLGLLGAGGYFWGHHLYLLATNQGTIEFHYDAAAVNIPFATVRMSRQGIPETVQFDAYPSTPYRLPVGKYRVQIFNPPGPPIRTFLVPSTRK